MSQSSLQDLKSWQFVYLNEVTSTNTYVKDNCANTNPRQKTVVFTDHQTEGRGQYGSTWSSEAKCNLLCSIYLPLGPESLDPSFPFQWNMYIAVVLRQVIQLSVDQPVKIKWPNDIIISDKKVAGILIQNGYNGSQLKSSTIGIGVNVNQKTFDKSLPSATSLMQLTNRAHDRLQLLYEIIATLDQESLSQSKLKNPNLIINLYNKHLYKITENVTCLDNHGNAMQGTLQYIDKNGELILQSNGAMLKLTHGQYSMALTPNLQ